MKREEAFALHQEMCERELALRKGKAEDYSGTEDVLSNFKLLPAICKQFRLYGCEIDTCTPMGMTMYMVLHKIVRLQNIISQRKGKVRNEPVDDSILDLRCYAELWRELYLEAQRYHEQLAATVRRIQDAASTEAQENKEGQPVQTVAIVAYDDVPY